MKRISITITLLMLFSILSIGQNIKHISLTFNSGDFELKQDTFGNTIIISKQHNCLLKSDTLLPALPYIGYNVLVSGNSTFCGLTSTCTKTVFQNNVLMSPNPVEIPTNMSSSSNIRNIPVFYNQDTYPQTYVEYVGMNESDGFRLLTFHVCPFEYDAVTRKLYLRTSINFDIHLNYSTQVLQSSNHPLRKTFVKDIIRKNILNPEDLDNMEGAALRTFSSDSLTKQTGFEYVIVTTNQLKNTFQELANWKNRKGIRAKVLTVEDIDVDTTYSKVENIKRALADIDGLSYVLLAGITRKVPTCMCYIGHHETADSITPADSYYACMGTMNWDRDGDGFYGELEDTVCLFPSLAVSRIRSAYVSHAQCFVNRIIEYESSPDTTNWHSSILMSGATMGYTDDNDFWLPFYDEILGFSDSQIWSQMIYDTYIAPSGTVYPSWGGARTRFYDTYTDMSNDGSYEFSNSNLQNELSKGYTFVDVKTHGGMDSWQMERHYVADLYNSNYADSLQNSGYTIITTTACLTNAFDGSHVSLSQSFMKNPQSGVLAYWGTSRENWYRERKIYELSSCDEFDGLTYRKLLEDKYHRMGMATLNVKAEMMSQVSTHYYTPIRKIWMGLNLIGDPEMPVYLSKPQYFSNVDIQFVNDSIYVNAGTDNFDICFINQDDSTEYYIARDIPNSAAVFKRLNGVFDVCITKPGYVPYFTVCGNTYLQNRTLSGTNFYQSKQVKIGSNVTNKIAHGPVVVNNGSTTVKVNQSATITKDFEVRQGAEFIITNE